MLEERKLEILNLIVGDYIKVGAPIASEAIARAHSLGVSPATIRNDVAELEQEGYISRPHQSAGSVPSDKGYRVYVETVAATRVASIPNDVRSEVRTRLVEVERDVDEWTSVAAAVLAQFVGNLAIATFPKASESRVRHIELVPLQDFLALLIVIFEQTRMRRQLVRLSEKIAPEALRASANRVNGMLRGLTSREIGSREMRLSPLEDELVATTLDMLGEEDKTDFQDHYLDGIRNLLDQPEFDEKDKVRAVIEGVEDGSLARAILDEVPATGVLRVVIGQENREDLLWPLSVVIGRYGIPGQADGAVGAVGPVRMEYGKAIAGVGMVVAIMNDMVEVVRA
jgi:heat-inducible transcriptional repressor